MSRTRHPRPPQHRHRVNWHAMNRRDVAEAQLLLGKKRSREHLHAAVDGEVAVSIRLRPMSVATRLGYWN